MEETSDLGLLLGSAAVKALGGSSSRDGEDLQAPRTTSRPGRRRPLTADMPASSAVHGPRRGGGRRAGRRRHLATGDYCHVRGALGQNVSTELQFHPEITREGMRIRINTYA